MTQRLQSILVPVVLALGLACAPTLRVNVLQPASVNLGSAKALSMVEITGKRSAREFVAQEIIRQARTDGFFTVTDRSEEGISVKIAGQTVTATGGKGQPQRADEIGLRIDIHDWTANRETIPEKRDQKTGKIIQEEKRVYEGKVTLGVTAFNAQGKAYLAESEFKVDGIQDDNEDGSIRSAASFAVRKLLAAVTPRYVQKDIRLDGDDEAQKPIIEVAKAGNLDRASTELKTYLEKDPTNPAALYNMAVLLDAQGRYQDALDLYTKAISNSTKEFYVKMKTECAKRLADQQALSQ